jgi:uncharacterized protein YjbI with pentapeptide repeats
MLGRRDREFPSHKTEPAAFAAKATDLDALRTAVVDAAGVGYGLWFSYLFVLLYFAIAAGAVTHRDLLLESAVKLPFLNVELPLKAFFILGPLVFPVVHAYVLLHFLLLAGKIGAFHAELQKQISEDEKRGQLRRQLPSNIFVQFLAGPREVREGIVGSLLKSVTGVSLVAGPIALLILFQLQFLAYHSAWITWWQRIAVVLDLVLLWLLWPPIARGETILLTWNDLGRAKVRAWLGASLLPLLLVFTVATFPGEWLHETLPGARFVPVALGAQASESRWASLYELLVAGEVDYAVRKPKSLWSNRLVLSSSDAGERIKVDPGGKIVISPESFPLRGRRLEGAVILDAHLKGTDLTGADLSGADFTGGDLREVTFGCDKPSKRCARLEGARFDKAQLQGAMLTGAQLKGASLEAAQLQGAMLKGAQLQGANLFGAQLQGAMLGHAQLQGALLDVAGLEGAWLTEAQLQGAQLQLAHLQAARLEGAQLQGALLLRAELQAAHLQGAQLQGAYLKEAQLQGAYLLDAQLQGALLNDIFVWRTISPRRKDSEGALIERPIPEPKYFGLHCADTRCDWTEASYVAFKAHMESVLPDVSRVFALEQIERLGQKPFEEDRTSAGWRDLAVESRGSAGTYPGRLAKRLIGIGCASDGAPYVVGGLIAQLDYRFEDNPSAKAEVARAFLDEANCPGAQGLSEEKKTKLGQMLSPRPNPGAASR